MVKERCGVELFIYQRLNDLSSPRLRYGREVGALFFYALAEQQISEFNVLVPSVYKLTFNLYLS